MSNASPFLLHPTESKDTRSGFGVGLYEVGQNNDRVVGLCADLTGSLKMNAFRDAFPDRFFQVGIAEANMMGLAAGMTIGGKIPFTGTFANFSTGRVYDQIRQSIAYSDKNVKICASHAGLTLGEDGATHQILEDIGLMKMLPNMTVVVPADYEQTRQATHAIAGHHGPVYLRFGRPKVPVFIKPETPFELGKIQRLMSGENVTLVACGHMVWEAIQAAQILAKDGIQADVLNVHTIKPFDAESLIESVRRTGAVVVAEEHQVLGGLGGTVAQTLAKHHPTRMAHVAVEDQFGESGTPAQLMKKYGLDAESIVIKTRELLA
ncbi:MAG: transketolase family protein [Bacteroidetes bacterium]|nr:transketolase family protein [Bacteroidota bacterium]MDA0902738.1 transketolase family protein [Bacteroidota bacterium]MDA1241819.1 transketolase family protein [Bacteroidota bacterium]